MSQGTDTSRQQTVSGSVESADHPTFAGGRASTAAQRASLAAQSASERLHAEDEKWLLAALAEIAVEELERSPGFALRVRNRYDEIRPVKKALTRAKPSAKGSEPLVPIKQLPWRHIELDQELDPYFILEYYGGHQLEAALRRQSLARLREGVKAVQARQPGAILTGRLTKENAIAYILQHVAPAN